VTQSDLPLLNWADIRSFRWQIAAEWLEIAQWSQWRAYSKPPSLFPMVRLRSMTPTTSPSLKMGISNAPVVTCRILNGYIHVSPQRVIRSISCFILCYRVFGVGGSSGAISGSIKSRMAASRQLGKLQRHRAVSLRQHGILVLYTNHYLIPAKAGGNIPERYLKNVKQCMYR